MKVKICCERMGRMMDMGVTVSKEPVMPMMGPMGIGLEMDYCPWCGARIEEARTMYKWDGRTFDEDELGDMFDEHFDEMVYNELGQNASELLTKVFEYDTDAYQALADVLEEMVRGGQEILGIKRTEE